MRPVVDVVGGGPAGLMAAEVLAGAGAAVTVLEARRSVGRTLLLAGRSGLNLTNAEPIERLLSRYGLAQELLEPAIRSFDPAAVRRWADSLGAATFEGSSGRVFPKVMGAAPLLRAWLGRLDELGVEVRTSTSWPSGASTAAEATILALGGASWPRVGGDGSWADQLRDDGIDVTPLAPANCGVLVDWAPVFVERFAGEPLKNVVVRAGDDDGVRGEPVVTDTGLEGAPIYAAGPAIRAQLATGRDARLEFDVQPDRSEKALAYWLSDRRRAKDSTTTWLRRANVAPVAVGLLREATGNDLPSTAARMAVLLKRVPISVAGLAPIERAISSAGGVAASAVDDRLMLRGRPGVFVAGEMLDWEAPTGGYLLQACLSTGAAAARGALEWLGD